VKMEKDENSFSFRETVLSCLVPHVGMKFRNPNEGWSFWLAYGDQEGFNVTKRYSNKSKMDRNVTSCRFVCANHGH
jgi:hypothetical protein